MYGLGVYSSRELKGMDTQRIGDDEKIVEVRKSR